MDDPGKERSIFDALTEDYNSGKFEVYRNELLNFISEKRRILVDYFAANFEALHVRELSEHQKLEILLKQYIIDQRVINPRSDSRDQLCAIYEHLWILGEQLRQPPDREKEAREWIEKYASAWREYRICALLFVLEKNLDMVISLLTASGIIDEVKARIASGTSSPVDGV